MTRTGHAGFGGRLPASDARPDRAVGMTGILDGTRAIVTGAASGIGAATARRFCEEGACVLLVDRDGDGAETAAAALREAGHHAHARAADVTDEVAVARV